MLPNLVLPSLCLDVLTLHNGGVADAAEATAAQPTPTRTDADGGVGTWKEHYEEKEEVIHKGECNFSLCNANNAGLHIAQVHTCLLTHTDRPRSRISEGRYRYYFDAI